MDCQTPRMLKPLPLRAVLPVVALVAGSATVVAAPATAWSAAVPSSHVKECTDAGLANAGAMTQVSSASAAESSGGLTSKASAWVYGVAGSADRCVVTRTVGAKVPRKARRSSDHSVGYLSRTDGRVVVDTGEVLPLNDAMSGLGGATGRSHVMAQVMAVTETERISPEDAEFLPPALAGLAGHDATLELSTYRIDLYSQAWTTTRLAKPLSKAQVRKKRAAELRLAATRHEARVAGIKAAREAQLAIAATETGLAATWRTFLAEDAYTRDIGFARASLRASKQLARQHAAEAGRGTDTREAYLHQIALTVPLG